MATRLTEEKTPKQQSIEQALRRLKYLHTSLLPHDADKTKQRERNFDRVLRTKGLQPAWKERTTVVSRRTSEKQVFYSLEPNTARKHREMGKTRVAKHKQNKKVIRTGRAPLRPTTYAGTRFSPKAEEEQFKWESNNVETSKKPTERVRSFKSASEMPCTVDSYKCVQCFANDSHKKQTIKKYYTNIRINRVTFSARPSGFNAKSTRKESKITVPKSYIFNGWGVRSKAESFTRANRASSGSERQVVDAMDVTAGLKTLKLETWTERMRQGCNEETIPQPPPTPVRQIDIKLPQGVVVKYQLSEDE